MTMLLQGSGSSPSAKAASNNSSAHDQSVSSETGSFLWFYYNNNNIRFWLPIVVLLNSCLTYVFFVRGSQNSPVAPILPDLQNSSSNSDTCDLSKGEWIFDSTPPLYTNSTCDQIQLLQNCLGNGRPDTGYLHWRWRPHNCELPLFDPATFLELMRAKSMLFFGDSLARNHMQSLLCSLSPLAFRTSLRSIATLDGYNGTTFLRTASPDHFEHGTWSNGGTCNRTRPTHSDAMPYAVASRDEARKFDPSNGSRLRVLDVTYSTFLRPDGHPGPYRTHPPYAGEISRYIRNDCLHWCLPGAVDMWNQLLLESVKKLEKTQ
ncbi:protein trichome birefringence-like 26 [Selaginella moellendorffii]|uniref:protein trichome birefringence-like 26 n=1 Tax=Selaginella moellendorffii TaxID=88036 RepID=UPI000D1C5E44|nr:protein trichome birefringence-like 26 [Selaginella moellendorffii]|eukprot:XP_024518112.1 protein trichome birefringence-like 26 [Selaginella moellendorffii]